MNENPTDRRIRDLRERVGALEVSVRTLEGALNNYGGRIRKLEGPTPTLPPPVIGRTPPDARLKAVVFAGPEEVRVEVYARVGDAWVFRGGLLFALSEWTSTMKDFPPYSWIVESGRGTP